MNITFLIGNGFDLNLGLKTKYSDFYKYYSEKEPDDYILKEIKNKPELWADLELGICKLFDEYDGDYAKLLDSKRSLEKHLVEYLSKENKSFTITNKDSIIQSFAKNIINLKKDLSVRDTKQFDNCIKGVHESICYRFITFNYTDTLDRVIKQVIAKSETITTHDSKATRFSDTISTPLHIHGDLSNGVIIGANDISQFTNDKLLKNKTVLNYLLKPTMNERLGNLKINEAKGIIDKSIYICIYGLSIGDTDNMWWSYVINWVLKSDERRIILYVHDDSLISQSVQEQLRFIDRNTGDFITHEPKLSQEQIDTITNRIIILHNSKIFDFNGYEIRNRVQAAAAEAAKLQNKNN